MYLRRARDNESYKEYSNCICLLPSLCYIRSSVERSHSGLVRSLGKRVYRKVSRVRIPLLPPRVQFVRDPASFDNVIFGAAVIRPGRRAPTEARITQLQALPLGNETRARGEAKNPSPSATCPFAICGIPHYLLLNLMWRVRRNPSPSASDLRCQRPTP